MPDLRTIPGVELLKAGRWDGVGGTFTITADDIEHAVEAHRAGAMRKPVIKIGHSDPRFDGSPALGYVDNLRLTDDGETLLGDLVNVPAAVAKLLPRAYPDRSIEGLYDYQAPDGAVWPFVITALALLGASAPAVRNLKSLQDVQALYDIAAAHRGRPVTIAAAVFHPTDLDARRRRAVQVAAARRRRTHRTMLGV